MKELEIKIINELIDFYSRYMVEGSVPSITDYAKNIESRYLNSSDLVDECVTQALGKLVDFYAPTGVVTPNKDTTKEILTKLRNRLLVIDIDGTISKNIFLELELDAIERLILAYLELDRTGITKELTEKTKDVYNYFIPTNTLLSKDVTSAVGKLFSVAYPNMDPDRKIPSKEEIKEIVFSLRTRMKELEK